MDMLSLCFVCKKQKHRYTCPRCNIQYCSVYCYKHEKHASCSELFYRDCFVHELKARQVSDEEKQQVIAMMKKVEEQIPFEEYSQDESDDEFRSLEERLEGLDLENMKEEEVDELWNRLTLEEQEDFKKFASSNPEFVMIGESFVHRPWEPWWMQHSSGLIVEMGAEEKDVPESPRILSNISALRSSLISGKTLSPLLPFNLVNVLYAYVFFQRLYNGSGASDLVEDFCESCLRSSDVLKENKTFSCAEESACSCMQRCVDVATAQELCVDNDFVTACLQDVSHLLVGPNPDSVDRYVCCALSELHTVFTEYHKNLKAIPSKAEPNTKNKRKSIFSAIKKLEFLLAWTSTYKEHLALLSVEISEIYKKRKCSDETHEQIQKEIEKKGVRLKPTEKSSKPLIVELN
ncbi:unnamed protein product [Clavelina lepadiformis]|uniref:HIT-type domain-containing protein n=1 Tax=Clavelina lepadiformis TaxID=159417 RepID=A0ABP0FD49_CLALP